MRFIRDEETEYEQCAEEGDRVVYFEVDEGMEDILLNKEYKFYLIDGPDLTHEDEDGGGSRMFSEDDIAIILKPNEEMPKVWQALYGELKWNARII